MTTWGTKYKAYLNYNQDSAKSQYEILLKQDGYVSSATDISIAANADDVILAADPLIKLSRGQGQDKDQCILGSEVIFKFIAKNDGTFDELIEADYKEWKLIINRLREEIGSLTSNGTATFDSSRVQIVQPFTVPFETDYLYITLQWSGSVGAMYTVSLKDEFDSLTYWSFETGIISASTVNVTIYTYKKLIPGTTYWLDIYDNTPPSNETIKTTQTIPDYLDIFKAYDGVSWTTDASSRALAMTINFDQKDFEGFINPNDCERTASGYRTLFIINATDGLANLKQFKYWNSTLNKPYTTLASALADIKVCLAYLEIQLPFRIQLNIYSDQMVVDQNALDESDPSQKIFNDDSFTEDGADSAFDVITKILGNFNCTLRQTEGYYWIISRAETISHFYQYSWALTLKTFYNQSATPINRAPSDLRIPIDDLKFVDYGRLQKIAPIKQLNINLKNYLWPTNPIANSYFNSDISSWNNSANPSQWLGSGNNEDRSFDTFAWSSDGTLHVADTSVGVLEKYFYTAAFSLITTSTTKTFKLTFRAKATWNFTNYQALNVYMVETPYALADASEPTSPATDNYFTEWHGHEFTFVIDDNVGVASNYRIYIKLIPNPDETMTTFDAYFDDFVLLQQNTNEQIRDQRTEFKPNVVTQYEIKKINISFKDASALDINGVATLTDNAVRTSTWTRYNKTENIPLIRVLGRQILNNYQRYKNLLTININDPDERFQSHNILKLGTSYGDTEFEVIPRADFGNESSGYIADTTSLYTSASHTGYCQRNIDCINKKIVLQSKLYTTLEGGNLILADANYISDAGGLEAGALVKVTHDQDAVYVYENTVLKYTLSEARTNVYLEVNIIPGAVRVLDDNGVLYNCETDFTDVSFYQSVISNVVGSIGKYIKRHTIHQY